MTLPLLFHWSILPVGKERGVGKPKEFPGKFRGTRMELSNAYSAMRVATPMLESMVLITRTGREYRI